VKSRNNKIWIFLFEGFNLAHSSSPLTFEVFGTRILAAKCSHSSDFGQLWGRLKKNTCFFGPGPMRDVYLDFGLSSTMACQNCRRNVDTREMATIWNLPCHHMNYLYVWTIIHISAYPASNRMVSSQKQKKQFMKNV
jgi:hypothetical protein